jgi:hypothetical protein
LIGQTILSKMWFQRCWTVLFFCPKRNQLHGPVQVACRNNPFVLRSWPQTLCLCASAQGTPHTEGGTAAS